MAVHTSHRVGVPWEVRPTIRQAFDEFAPDVVHVQGTFAICSAAIREAKRRGVALVATNHLMPENLLPFVPAPDWLKRIVKWWMWKDMDKKFADADILTTPTSRSAEEMAKNGIQTPIRVISNGIDLQQFSGHGSHGASDVPTVLFVGRLAKEKHVDQIIRAIAQAVHSANLRLEIVGGGEQLPMLMALCDDLNVSNRVRFLGRVTDEELRDAYLRCTMFCMPGTADLQSLATLEALSASKPVLVANALALPHLVRDGVNGYLFEPGSVSQLADRMVRIATSTRTQLDAMARASRAIAERHSIEKSIDTVESLYREAIGGQSGRRSGGTSREADELREIEAALPALIWFRQGEPA
ncbi:glycosyltransferase [Agromyces bracchium]|uniref:D-inositol 3-phosphate glycosyltransferase n=1 Tax=Agromyces bracchium TaxID=88376 RepID=A0A6I3LZC9_9MICO|nr:glycosyltransferase [Agromyces bracchium]